MRKVLTALLLGATLASTAAPAMAADDKGAQHIGDRLRERIADDRARNEERRERWEERRDRREERREERQERRDERRDDRRDHRDDRRDEWRDRRDDRRGDRHWDDRRDDRRWNDRRGYDYRYYGGSNWNRQWTPYGFGYHDSFTRNWVFRNFADRNSNGRVSEKEWRRAQTSFYRLADRDYDGYISRYEYDWALRVLQREYGGRW